MVGRPKGEVKRVFSFRSRPELVNQWRAYAAVTGMTVDELGTKAMERYLAENPLTEDEQARINALLALKTGEAIRQWPLIIDRGSGGEKVAFASEDDRKEAIARYKAEGTKVIMAGAAETIVRTGGGEDEPEE